MIRVAPEPLPPLPPGIGTTTRYRITYYKRGQVRPWRLTCALWQVGLRSLQKTTGGRVVAYEVRDRVTGREIARGRA